MKIYSIERDIPICVNYKGVKMDNKDNREF